MTRMIARWILGVAMCGVLAIAPTSASAPDAEGMSVGTAALESAGALAFGPNGVLFVGDSRGAAVFALDVQDAARDTSDAKLEISNIDQKIAALLGTTPDAVSINDMAVHPVSHRAYFSVSRGRGADATPVILRTGASHALEEVPLSSVRYSRAAIANPPAIGAKTSWGADLRSMAITDLVFADGQLLVAGLSNEEFASQLRRVPFPFTSPMAVTALEIFHTSHDRYETNSPIETFLPYRLNGKPALLAGYGCAPIATFPMDALFREKKLRGTTVAELGGGNRPLDMIAIKHKGQDAILIANSDRTLMRMAVADIEKAPPMTTAVEDAYVDAGVPYVSIAVVGVTQLADLNDRYAVLVKRDVDTGTLDVISIGK